MDFIIELLIQYQSIKVIGIILMLIGTIYCSLILLRSFLIAIVSITKTDKDNKIINTIYNFIDTYSLSFEKLKEYSKVKEVKEIKAIEDKKDNK